MSTKLRLMMITIIFVVSILSAVKVRVLIYQLIGEVSDQSASRWIGKKGDSIPTSGDPIPTHRVKRRRGSKPGAARVTTAVIPNLRLPSPQSLLNGITDNTTVFCKETVNLHKNVSRMKRKDELFVHLKYVLRIRGEAGCNANQPCLSPRYYPVYQISSPSSLALVIYHLSIPSQHSWPSTSSFILNNFSRGPRTALRYIVNPFYLSFFSSFSIKRHEKL
ncbi:hypothetical protein MJO28_000270 [Puccinia striiformis f. sp. tritici]|uniref:Uncharacterized protein n=1 Tax=Puccinia striiformis f. sp. tritici TaxID=168172 RepID=A0ACC0EY27_9BASI|nr:hypothetical protein MJO28_000270 [Puccinia striiformis f. sp. tritici]